MGEGGGGFRAFPFQNCSIMQPIEGRLNQASIKNSPLKIQTSNGDHTKLKLSGHKIWKASTMGRRSSRVAAPNIWHCQLDLLAILFGNFRQASYWYIWYISFNLKDHLESRPGRVGFCDILGLFARGATRFRLEASSSNVFIPWHLQIVCSWSIYELNSKKESAKPRWLYIVCVCVCVSLSLSPLGCWMLYN